MLDFGKTCHHPGGFSEEITVVSGRGPEMISTLVKRGTVNFHRFTQLIKQVGVKDIATRGVLDHEMTAMRNGRGDEAKGEAPLRVGPPLTLKHSVPPGGVAPAGPAGQTTGGPPGAARESEMQEQEAAAPRRGQQFALHVITTQIETGLVASPAVTAKRERLVGGAGRQPLGSPSDRESGPTRIKLEAKPVLTVTRGDACHAKRLWDQQGPQPIGGHSLGPEGLVSGRLVGAICAALDVEVVEALAPKNLPGHASPEKLVEGRRG